MRLIDADALSEMMYHEAFETDSDMQKWDSGCWIRYKMFENCIDAQPTIELKKGKWMEENTRSASYIFKCSCCGKNAYFVHGKGRGRNCENRYCGYDYCPNCGADMRENNS